MRNRERVESLGEVFTPIGLVEKMLQLLPKEVLTEYVMTILDNSCGNGNFLVEVMKQRIMNGISHKNALSTIYGVDIDELNVKECKDRLLMGKSDPDLIKIVDNNIICADALDPQHKGWYNVGYMWDKTKPTNEKMLETFFE